MANIMPLVGMLTPKERTVLLTTLNHDPCYDIDGDTLALRRVLNHSSLIDFFLVDINRAEFLLIKLIDVGFPEYRDTRKDILSKLRKIPRR